MIINLSSSVVFSYDDFFSKIYYSYSKDTSNVSSKSKSYSYSDLPYAEALTLDVSYKFDKYYTVKYKNEYDLVADISKRKEYVLNIDKKCWNLDIKFTDNLVASATADNSAIRQNIFYVQIVLKPILKIKQKYIQKNTKE
jgi:LPS-assembly protein